MIKVLHVYKTFYPETVGGVEQYIYNICKATERHGISHTILCTTQYATKEVAIFNGIKVIKYPATVTMSSCPMSLSLLMNFKKEAEDADIVHYQYPWPFAYLLAPFASGKKSVVTYQSDIVRQKVLRRLLYPLDQYFLYKADKILATSDQYASLSPNLRRFASKTEVVPITISRENYPKPNLAACDAIRKRLGKFYLFIGQLRHYKGLDALLEAMKELPSIRLVIIGDGATRASLERMCARSGMQNVTFLGNVSDQDKVNYLQACFGVVLPSNSKAEAFGISLLEGAMFQKPLISCSIGTGVEFVNKHLETGLVVPPTPEHLKAAMLKISQTPKLADRMGAKALERFETLFNYDVIGRKLAALYKKLLLGKKVH